MTKRRERSCGIPHSRQAVLHETLMGLFWNVRLRALAPMDERLTSMTYTQTSKQATDAVEHDCIGGRIPGEGYGRRAK